MMVKTRPPVFVTQHFVSGRKMGTMVDPRSMECAPDQGISKLRLAQRIAWTSARWGRASAVNAKIATMRNGRPSEPVYGRQEMRSVLLTSAGLVLFALAYLDAFALGEGAEIARHQIQSEELGQGTAPVWWCSSGVI